MYYVETSILVSYVMESEKSHEVSKKVLEEVAREGRLYASTFTLIELYNTVCRKMGMYRLVEPLQRYLDKFEEYEDKCRVLLSMMISFLRERLKINFVDHEDLYEFTPMNMDRLVIPKVFENAIRLSPKLRIRIKDLLHLAYAHALSSRYEIRYFLTRDVENFSKIKDLVKQILGIEIILIDHRNR